MRKPGMLVAAVAVMVLGFAGGASAQSLRDAPAGGNEICDGAEGFEGQAGPFEPARSGFVDNGCGGSQDGGDGGEDGGEEDGAEESNPFCDGLAQAPEEMAPLTGPIGEGASCTAAEEPGGDASEEEVAQPPSSDPSPHPTGAVLSAGAEGGGGGETGALPATGAELLAGASLGLASLGTALTRRFLR